MWGSSAVASVGSGAIVATFGFGQLCLIAATISLMAIIFTWSQRAVLVAEIG